MCVCKSECTVFARERVGSAVTCRQRPILVRLLETCLRHAMFALLASCCRRLCIRALVFTRPNTFYSHMNRQRPRQLATLSPSHPLPKKRTPCPSTGASSSFLNPNESACVYSVHSTSESKARTCQKTAGPCSPAPATPWRHRPTLSPGSASRRSSARSVSRVRRVISPVAPSVVIVRSPTP